MYVTLLLAALLILGLSCLTAYFVKVRRRARKRQAVAARLDAVVVQAKQVRDRDQRHRAADAQVSAALTTVLPAIRPEDRSPRHVA